MYSFEAWFSFDEHTTINCISSNLKQWKFLNCYTLLIWIFLNFRDTAALQKVQKLIAAQDTNRIQGDVMMMMMMVGI